VTAATSPPASFALPALPVLKTATIFGRAIRYYDIGEGPPLVLIHGIGGDADQWAFVFGALAAANRVIAFDLLGFGRSDKPAIDYRVEGYVEFLDRLLRAIGIGRASVLGHSYGGWIAASFALAFPERVDKLVLADAAGIDAGATPIPIDLNVSSRRAMRESFEFMFHDKAFASDALVDLAYSLHLERGDGHAIRSALATLADSREKLDARLGELRVPTLLLWGEQDALTPVAMAHEFHRRITGSRLELIPECGHLPPLEKAAEFARAVTRFLRDPTFRSG
jgi:triacylglycerol lipase